MQVDLTHAVGKFLVEQARGSTHAPASSQEEDALLIYNYQTTFTGKVGLQELSFLGEARPLLHGA